MPGAAYARRRRGWNLSAFEVVRGPGRGDVATSVQSKSEKPFCPVVVPGLFSQPRHAPGIVVADVGGQPVQPLGPVIVSGLLPQARQCVQSEGIGTGTATLLTGRSGTQANPLARPGQPPPADTGMIPLTVPEARRLITAGSSPPAPGQVIRSSGWTRRHQARARWFHHRTRLERALPGISVPGEFTGREAALDLLDAERASLVAAVSMAADTGRDQAALRLPLVLAVYLA